MQDRHFAGHLGQWIGLAGWSLRHLDRAEHQYEREYRDLAREREAVTFYSLVTMTVPAGWAAAQQDQPYTIVAPGTRSWTRSFVEILGPRAGCPFCSSSNLSHR